MNSQSKRTDVLDELDVALREPVERIRKDSAPGESMASTLARVRSLVAQRNQPTASTRALVAWVSRRGMGLIGGMTAAAIMLMFVVLSDPAQSLAADVAESFKKCDWVHVVQSIKGMEEKVETWYSFKDDISIQSNAESIEFRRHHEAEYERYEKSERTLYRLSEGETPRRFNPLAGLVDALPLLVNDNPDDDAIEDLRLLKQLGWTVEVGGHRVVRHQGLSDLVVILNVDGRTAKVVISVDDATKLPQACRIVSDEDKELALSFQFNYPPKGPEDIYALGVPNDAQVVDRVPRESEKLLFASIKNGSSQFDDYRALAITYDPNDELWWVNARKELIYRKGKKWRRNHLRIQFHPDPERTQPDEALRMILDSGPKVGTNLSDWWAARLKNSPEPDGKLSEVFVGFNQAIGRWSVLPEFHARPPIGQAGLIFAVRVDPDSSDGPDGTILVEYSNTTIARDRAKPGQTLAKSQYWIDPEKGHLVTRMQTLGGDGNVISRTNVESTAKTPNGVWYPTKIRQESRSGDDLSVETTDYYLTFPDEISDSLFE